jgi:carbon storage regulator CsrA
VVVTVVSVHGQAVRIGIEAPPAVKIWREELLDAESAARVASLRRESRPTEVSV